MRRNLKLALAAFVSAMAVGAPAQAEDLIPGGEERFKIIGGGVLAFIDSSVGINGTATDGSIIDLETPGLGKDANNFMLGATWRVGSRHRVSGMYFTTRKQRSVSFNQQVTIGDDTLIPPATLTADSRNRFLLADYHYSFVKNKNVELAGVLGAYINKFTVDLEGTANVQNNVNGQITTTTRAVAYRPSITVPMPLIGGSIDWFATPRLTVGGSLTGLKAKVGDIDGSIYVVTASAEYMIKRNIGLGLAYMHADLDVDVTKSNFNGALNWKNDNILGYFVLKF